MKRPQVIDVARALLLTSLVAAGGCQNEESAATASRQSPDQPATPAESSEEPAAAPAALPSISLGGASATAAADSDSGSTERRRRRELIDAMDPLQVMLGSWKGTTQKEFGDFKALDEPEWVWDFQTDPDQPALVMTTDASPYFQQVRLTYLTDDDQFRLQITGQDEQRRVLTGTFSRPVEEFQGDDKRMHRRYKLELTETDPADDKDIWQVVFNQQENNRYLVELSRRRGTGFMRFDTIANQRQGTSFALSDEDYGEKACIITGGLGTSTVSYQGKTYWVCCSGCRAAFEDDPAKWIAAAADLDGDEN